MYLITRQSKMRIERDVCRFTAFRPLALRLKVYAVEFRLCIIISSISIIRVLNGGLSAGLDAQQLFITFKYIGTIFWFALVN